MKTEIIMPILPEAKITCPKCQSSVIDIDPKWIALASVSEENKGNPWAKIRKLVLKEFKTFGELKGWMIQGVCPEKECDGKWWDGERLHVSAPTNLVKAKEHV